MKSKCANTKIRGIMQVPDMDQLMDMGVAFGRSSSNGSGQCHKGQMEWPFAEEHLHLDRGLGFVSGSPLIPPLPLPAGRCPSGHNAMPCDQSLQDATPPCIFSVHHSRHHVAATGLTRGVIRDRRWQRQD